MVTIPVYLPALLGSCISGNTSQALFLHMPVQNLVGNKDSFIQEKSAKMKDHFGKTQQ